MQGVRPRGIPPLPWLSRFLELNVRTYVTLRGAPGVYFFSLDAGNPLAVAAARRWFLLPYYRADMQWRTRDGVVEYRSRRTHHAAPPAQLSADYRPRGEPFTAEPGSFAEWATERYRLYTADARGAIWTAEIRHPRWSLQEADAEIQGQHDDGGSGRDACRRSPRCSSSRAARTSASGPLRRASAG